MAAEDAASRPRSLSPGAAVPGAVPASAPAAASGSPFAALDLVRSAASSSASSSGGHTKPPRRSKRKKRHAKTERTPLLGKPEEEVHPLPWFRSPEWTRSSPARLDVRRGRRRGPETAGRRAEPAHRRFSCFPCGGDAAETESDLETGLQLPAKDGGDADADSFKQCIQFLVGLIVLVAVALILLIIFQPLTPPPPHRLP